MSPLLWAAPVWFIFELCQLIIAERYTGIRQIARGTDPRLLPLKSSFAAAWAAGIFLYWAWMAIVVFQPIGQLQIIGILSTTVIGFSVRKSCTMKWVLVTLTFEAAVRIGMLLSLVVIVLRHR